MLPNFLIIGVQKAATSWLAACLQEHPDVFMSKEKEVHFFDKHFDKGQLWYEAHFADWAGHEARIKYAEPVDGARQVSGIIEGISGDTIRVATPKGGRQVDFANIASAKLLLTDKLINATAPLSTEGADLIKTEG